MREMLDIYEIAATDQAVGRLAAIHQGVLTGKLREVAHIKLEVFGLSALLDLSASAYGDDDSDRAKLAGIAQFRA